MVLLLAWFLPPSRVMVNGEIWTIQMQDSIAGDYEGYTNCARHTALIRDNPELTSYLQH